MALLNHRKGHKSGKGKAHSGKGVRRRVTKSAVPNLPDKHIEPMPNAALPPNPGQSPDVPEPVDRVPIRPGDITLAPGYRIEPVVVGLDFPNSLTFDDQGRLYIGEGGFSYGEARTPEKGRILRVNDDSSLTEVASGFRAPMTSITWHEGNFYVAEGAFPGRILRVNPNGDRRVLVDGLISGADHFTGEVVFGPDEKMYFSVGSATNSAVVGIDNYYVFNWLPMFPTLHDIPARDLTLNGRNFQSIDPFVVNPQSANRITGPYKPFGTPAQAGEVIKGQLLSTSVMYQANKDGSGLRRYLDGFRNIFGLEFSPDGRLFFTENGFDDRGSRPIEGKEPMWEAKEGTWYGFPDFQAGIPVTQLGISGRPQPEFVLAQHPEVERNPVAVWEDGASPMKFDFSTNDAFGFKGWAFVPLFGDFDLATPTGYKVVRVNVDTKETQDFLVINRPSVQSTGPIHPVAMKFSPDGKELYLLDFGGLFAFGGMIVPWAESGILWRITRNAG